MQKFKFNGAVATTAQLTKSGLCEAIFSGPMTPEAFNLLRYEALQATRDCTGYVIRLDKALILLGEDTPVNAESFASDTPAGAMVVRPGEYAFWLAYAKKAAKFGVIRTIWPAANARLAYLWAANRACLRTAELQR